MAAGQSCGRQGAAVRNLQAAVAVAKMDAFQQTSSFEQFFSRLVADVPHFYCCSGFHMGCASQSQSCNTSTDSLRPHLFLEMLGYRSHLN